MFTWQDHVNVQREPTRAPATKVGGLTKTDQNNQPDSASASIHPDTPRTSRKLRDDGELASPRVAVDDATPRLQDKAFSRFVYSGSVIGAKLAGQSGPGETQQGKGLDGG